MIDPISIGGIEYQATPMNLVEAVEVMFTLAPYVPSLVEQKELIDSLDVLLKEAQEQDPMDLFRLLAYMLHTDAEELILNGASGEEVVTALASCWQENSLPDLIDAAFMLGIVSARWSDDG